jgi:integration host factor subunit alpha
MIGAALEHEDEVKLSRFGNFVVRSKAAREGRNPKTGEEATIAARRVVTFRPSPMLKAQVDNK